MEKYSAAKLPREVTGLKLLCDTPPSYLEESIRVVDSGTTGIYSTVKKGTWFYFNRDGTISRKEEY